MNRDQRNLLLTKLAAIDRNYKSGHYEKAHTALLKVVMNLITDVYTIDKEMKKENNDDDNC